MLRIIHCVLAARSVQSRLRYSNIWKNIYLSNVYNACYQIQNLYLLSKIYTLQMLKIK